METVNNYGPWAVGALGILSTLGMLIRNRLGSKSPASPASPAAAGSAGGFLGLLLNLPKYIEQVTAIIAVVNQVATQLGPVIKQILDALKQIQPPPVQLAAPYMASIPTRDDQVEEIVRRVHAMLAAQPPPAK